MEQLSILGLFCEDIREESGDVLTLVGLLPDSVTVQPMQIAGERKEGAAFQQNKFLAKVCIYARANFDPDDPIKEIKLRLVLPNDDELPVGSATTEVIERAKREAKEKDLPLAGVIMRAVLGGFKLPKPGILRLEADIDSKKQLLAMMKFQAEEINPPGAS